MEVRSESSPSPFLDDSASNADENRVSLINAVNRGHLEPLLERHIAWIFNLSRSRRDLYEYLRDNSSLVNQDNDVNAPAKPVPSFKGALLTQTSLNSPRLISAEQLDAFMEVAASVYRGHPFYEPAEQAKNRAPGPADVHDLDCFRQA